MISFYDLLFKINYNRSWSNQLKAYNYNGYYRIHSILNIEEPVELPNMLYVYKSSMYIHGVDNIDLPEILYVDNRFSISNCYNIELPKCLFVGDVFMAYNTKYESYHGMMINGYFIPNNGVLS